MTIYPAILTDSIEKVQEQVNQAKDLSDVSTVQIDVLDGKFADNLTVTPADLPQIDWGELQVDIHLMVDEPLDYVYELIDVKEQVPVRAVIGQIEKMSNQDHFLEDIQKNEWLPGVSLDVFTPIDSLEAATLDRIKVIQVMGIEAGFQGQTFKAIALEKIEQLAKPCKELGIELVVDGGVNLETIEAIAKAGATSAAVGSALWKSDQISETIQQLQHSGD